jgi:hypothetical protein
MTVSKVKEVIYWESPSLFLVAIFGSNHTCTPYLSLSLPLLCVVDKACLPIQTDWKEGEEKHNKTTAKNLRLLLICIFPLLFKIPRNSRRFRHLLFIAAMNPAILELKGTVSRAALGF